MSPFSTACTECTALPIATARQELRQAADELVGSVFYGTLLRQLRDSSLRGPYGHGGRGEEAFQAQLDQILASRAGGARSTQLSEAVARRYERQTAAVDLFEQRRREALREMQAELRSAAQADSSTTDESVGYGIRVQRTGITAREVGKW